MINTLIPIQTITLSANTNTVTFSGIPQNYKDLKLVVSARDVGNDIVRFSLGINSTSASSFTKQFIYTDGSTVTATALSGVTSVAYGSTRSSYTANSFGSSEFLFTDYTSSKYKCYLAQASEEANSASCLIGLSGGVIATASPITSLSVICDAPTFSSGSTFTLYGISNGTKATGGTVTVAGGYVYHTFTSTDSFLPNQQIKNTEVLVISGGAGSVQRFGGGGGAGGVLYSSGLTLSAGTTYTAIVAAGAANANATNSVFYTLSPTGGGHGGGTNEFSGLSGAGGSGGGGVGGALGGALSTGGAGTVGQGNNGGAGGYYRCGGGGGGAGAVGEAAGPSSGAGNGYGGNGGVGTAAYSAWGLATGTGQNVNGVVYYAGGGGGGANLGNPGDPSWTSGHGYGGYGGGGNGGAGNTAGGSANLITGTNGTANTGGGGGGMEQSTGQTSGGSGIIIVRYPLV